MLRPVLAVIAAAVALSPQFVAAQNAYCDEVWANRNLIFDRAGYCFASPLGQSVFDNADCSTQQPRLDAFDQAAVDLMREAEEIAGCAVDTNRTALDPGAAAVLARLSLLTRVPGRDYAESGCIGYNGPTAALRAGPSDTAALLGEIGPGMTVIFAYLPVGDWSYVITTDGAGTELGHGYVWSGIFSPNMPCRQVAG